MNVNPHGQFGHDAPSSDFQDDKMDQIRNLLFGEYERQNNARIAELENRVKELELGVHRRLDGLQSALKTLAADVTADQRSAFDELAQGIAELGDRIRRSYLRD